MIKAEELPNVLLQQAEEAYRNAPDGRDCCGSAAPRESWWLGPPNHHHRHHARTDSHCSSVSSRSSDSCASTETVTTTSWANFPVCLRTEQHPSMLSLDLYLEEVQQQPHEEPTPESESPHEEGPDDSEFFIAPDQLLQLNRIISCTEASPDSATSTTTTFGWGDFPLVAQQVTTPSFDYPWRYHKADEDEEIVPLSAPAHVKPTSLTTTTIPQPQPPSHINNHNNRRTVSFTTVRIREYRECLGDHPWCPQYPVSLDWTFHNEITIDVDVYEEQARETCCWSSTPRRMEVLERRCRLARSMRVTKAEIDVLESYRQEQVLLQQEAASEVMTTPGEGEDSSASCSSSTPTPSSLHRIRTMIVLPEQQQ